MGVLDGKVALVTGAGRLRGIGRATAVALAAAGADVVVTGTGRDPATFPADEKAVNWHDVHSTVEQIEAQGRRGLGLIGDVSQHVLAWHARRPTVRRILPSKGSRRPWPRSWHRTASV